MDTMLKKLTILLVLFLVGCERDPNPWKVKYVPTTDEERKAVAEHIQKILNPPPSSLKGDPDWDDSILVAHEEASKIFCRPTLWELDRTSYYRETGKWRYCDEQCSALSMENLNCILPKGHEGRHESHKSKTWPKNENLNPDYSTITNIISHDIMVVTNSMIAQRFQYLDSTKTNPKFVPYYRIDEDGMWIKVK